jgi:hypothetical protein
MRTTLTATFCVALALLILGQGAAAALEVMWAAGTEASRGSPEQSAPTSVGALTGKSACSAICKPECETTHELIGSGGFATLVRPHECLARCIRLCGSDLLDGGNPVSVQVDHRPVLRLFPIH